MTPLSPRRRTAILVSLAAGVGLFAAIANGHYEIERWLIWIYLRFLLLTALTAAAVLSVGDRLLTRVLRTFPPTGERLFFSFALGLLVFGLGIFCLGLAHLLTAPVFWLWPTACLAAGASSLGSFLRRAHRHRLHLLRRPAGIAPLAIAAFGAAGVLLLYVNMMVPGNAGYDARWYHFALAEHYVAAGAITAFPEGFFGGAWPHLGSWLYTWAFLSGGSLFSRMELAAHLEFMVFVATLAGLPILVRWMLHGRRAPLSWAAVFLFPGILLYDSSLCGGSDHILAFWALATLLALRRAWNTFEPRACLLLACVAAGAALTKYQAIFPLAFPAAAFLMRAVVARRRGLRAFLITGGAFVVLCAPHWLKNLLWYGDPFYPLLRGHLADHPWVPGALAGFTGAEWLPSGRFLSSLASSFAAVFTFSFIPHDWPAFHGTWPVFGSLFTLSLPALAFLPRSGRIWIAAGAALAGVFVWYWTFHQDRYLQALLPFMAAVVAAIVIRLWESGRAVRGAVSALIALQIIWGGDVYFFPTHTMIWRSPVQAVVDLMSTGYRRDWRARSATGVEFETVAALLPPDGKVLVHESELRLGTGRMVVMDARGAQGAIDYASLRTPRAIWDLLRSFGVTHLLWRPGVNRPDQRLSDEVVFLNFAARYAEKQTARGALRVGALAQQPPPAADPIVAVSGRREGTRVALADLDALAGRPPTDTGVAPPSDPPDVWLLDLRITPGRRPTPPPGFEVAGEFPPFLIATGSAAGL